MKKLMLIIFLVGILTLSLSAQANTKDMFETGQQAASTTNHDIALWTVIIGVLGLTAAAIGGAFAQSNALRTAMENIGRNPAAADSIRGILIIGLALIESLVIYVLLIDFIVLMVNWGDYALKAAS